ncbi:DUF192 domain-containing protein [Bacteriovoracaceae bacterium]|nr:DUF192 domain-containing protein [Bacteriovoracaceae bacterium]|tara:strand:+ start:46570 stop:46911 length:342 start_codon:yes stop_codon:yes gene_type:complete
MMSFKKGESVIAAKVNHANNIFTRMKGLMFSESLGEFDGLLITPCNSIHTFFMKYPIDVVFLSKDYKVVKVRRNIKPWRMTGIYFGAFQVLEMNAGTLSPDINPGDQLEVTRV